MKRIRKRTDGGYSLLELVVTIALLAAVGTGVSALMVTATRLYASQSATVRLQSKAQLLNAQLRGYYLSADGGLRYEEDVLSYTANGAQNAVVYDAEEKKLYLAEALDEAQAADFSVRDLPLLADHVERFTIELPVSVKNALPAEIVTTYTLEERGARVDVNFVTALRNHMRDEEEDERAAE